MKGLKLINTINRIWRFYGMYKQTMGFLRGMGAGIVTGAVVGAIGSQKINKNRRLKRRANKAMRTVGQMMNNVQYMFK